MYLPQVDGFYLSRRKDPWCVDGAWTLSTEELRPLIANLAFESGMDYHHMVGLRGCSELSKFVSGSNYLS